MQNFASEFKQKIKPLLHLGIIVHFNKPYKFKVWHFLAFFVFLFVFGFISGFISTKYSLTSQILSAPVFASVFGCFILAVGYNKGQGKLEMLKISEKKIETIAKINSINLKDKNEISLFTTDVIRYFTINSIIALHDLIIAIKLEKETEKAIKTLIFNMNAEIFTIPVQGNLIKKMMNGKPLLSQIFWLFDASKEEVLNYSILNSEVFISSTDTIPGIFCKMGDEKSARKIYKIKGRTFEKPLAIYTANPLSFLEKSEITEKFLSDLNCPLTIVSLPKGEVAGLKYSIKNGLVGIRILSKTSKMFEFLQKNNLNLIGTSANLSNDPSPSKLADVSPKIKENIPVFAIEENESLVQSSIVKIQENQFTIIREGLHIQEITSWLEKFATDKIQSFQDGIEKTSYIINLNKNEE
jgi:L-threonylcarbamoyladenylate synthase